FVADRGGKPYVAVRLGTEPNHEAPGAIPWIEPRPDISDDSLQERHGDPEQCPNDERKWVCQGIATTVEPCIDQGNEKQEGERTCRGLAVKARSQNELPPFQELGKRRRRKQSENKETYRNSDCATYKVVPCRQQEHMPPVGRMRQRITDPNRKSKERCGNGANEAGQGEEDHAAIWLRSFKMGSARVLIRPVPKPQPHGFYTGLRSPRTSCCAVSGS